VAPLDGGLNHGVFSVEADGRVGPVYCLKLHAADRGQAAREWWALGKLAPTGLAPAPLGFTPPGGLAPTARS
jgi:hypothetical protein